MAWILLAIVISGILLNCSVTSFEIDEAFEDNIQAIEQIAKYNHNTTDFWFKIIFVPELKKDSGVPALTEDGEIKIDPDEWLTWNFEQRQFVLLHEIGHLVDGFKENEPGIRIMNTLYFDSYSINPDDRNSMNTEYFKRHNQGGS